MPEQEATVLAREVKEHERRAGQKEGFSEHPGDCLAYKHYRDVRICRVDSAVEGWLALHVLPNACVLCALWHVLVLFLSSSLHRPATGAFTLFSPEHTSPACAGTRVP